VREKKKENETPILETVVNTVFGQPDEGLTLPETYARRVSNTVLSSSWWLDTMQIDDASGDRGSPSSWEFRVFFDPNSAGSLKLGDHLEDEERALEKRELARAR